MAEMSHDRPSAGDHSGRSDASAGMSVHAKTGNLKVLQQLIGRVPLTRLFAASAICFYRMKQNANAIVSFPQHP
jgi:hypothetical protein